MAWEKGKSGNPGGRPAGRRLISQGIELELSRVCEEGDCTKARKIAKQVVDKALAGEPWAIQFVTERTEGKPDQHVSITRNIRELSDDELSNIAAGSGSGNAEAPDSEEVPSQVH